MEIVITTEAQNDIQTYYLNVMQKYPNTFTYENAIEQSDKVYDAIASSAQNIIIKKEPLLDILKDGVTIESTKAEGVPWYYTARIDNDLIIVENAIHENNMSNRAFRRGSSNPTANLSNDDRSNQKILEIDSKTIKRIVSEVIRKYISNKGKVHDTFNKRR